MAHDSKMLELAMADEAKFFYTNAVEVGITQYDITFTFQRNGGVPPAIGSLVEKTALRTDAQAVVHDTLSVGMSLAHAKTMVASMVHLIQLYESQLGVVPIPPEYVDKWNKLVREG